MINNRVVDPDDGVCNFRKKSKGFEDKEMNKQYESIVKQI